MKNTTRVILIIGWIVFTIINYCQWESSYTKLSKKNIELTNLVIDLNSKIEVLDEKVITAKKDAEIYRSMNNDLEKDIQYYKNQIDGSNPLTTLSKKDVILLAKTAQTEAGPFKNHNESQKLVTSVILNRLKSPNFPDNIHDIIYDKRGGVQFCVAYDGSLDKVVLEPETLINVYEVLLYGYEVPLDVQYFYASYLDKTAWVTKLKTYAEVQGTIFSYNHK